MQTIIENIPQAFVDMYDLEPLFDKDDTYQGSVFYPEDGTYNTECEGGVTYIP